jgi:hypothetical protein
LGGRLRTEFGLALGTASRQRRSDNAVTVLGGRLREASIYKLLADHGDRLFPDDYFADLFRVSARGRPTVPAWMMAR